MNYYECHVSLALASEVGTGSSGRKAWRLTTNSARCQCRRAKSCSLYIGSYTSL